MSTDTPPDIRVRRDAQRRADRIQAFQEELRTLEAEGLPLLTPDQRARVEAHHAARLAALQQAFDIDRDATTEEMSRGMQAASFFGAVAFSAAVFSFFFRIWGGLSTSLQVALAITATILAVIGIEIADRRERSGYIAALVALVACACFVLQLIVFGQVFNLRPTPGAFLACGAFGLALGYAYGLRLPLLIGISGLGIFIASLLPRLIGAHWTEAFNRPELVLFASLCLLSLPLIHRQLRARWPVPEVDGVVRFVALLAALPALLLLTLWGRSSVLPLSHEAVEILYQVIFVPVALLAIGVGLRRRWSETYRIGATFLTLFLLTRFFDWYWEWMPKYLFFLILGALALALLFALRRLRRHLLATPPPHGAAA